MEKGEKAKRIHLANDYGVLKGLASSVHFSRYGATALGRTVVPSAIQVYAQVHSVG